MDPLSALLLTKENLMVMAGTWVLLQVAFKLLPPKILANQVFVRLMPLWPIMICLALVIFIPGIAPVNVPPIEKVLLGLILGYAVGHSHKIVFQSMLGADSRLTKDDLPDPAVSSGQKP